MKHSFQQNRKVMFLVLGIMLMISFGFLIYSHLTPNKAINYYRIFFEGKDSVDSKKIDFVEKRYLGWNNKEYLGDIYQVDGNGKYLLKKYWIYYSVEEYNFDN